MTATNVLLIRNAINKFVAENGRAPTNVNELIGGKVTRETLNDGWNSPLHYECKNPTNALLISLGKDRKPGGKGENADWIWRFTLKDASDNWIGTNWQKGSLNWVSDGARLESAREGQ